MIPQIALPAPCARQLRTARQLAEDRRRTREERQLPTACPGLDRLLAGGLRRGMMVELIGRRSSGRFSLVLAALAAATGRGEAAALVDLGMPPVPGGRGGEASWLRLARSAQAHRAALLISSPYRVSGTAAQAVLEARSPRARWRGRGPAPRLLRGVSARLELVKSRGVGRDGPREGDVEALSLRPAAEIGGEPWSEGGGVVVELSGTPDRGAPDREEDQRAIA